MSWYHEDLPMSDPIFRAIAMVRDRLIRVVDLLQADEVPFAVCGGWAVAGWRPSMKMRRGPRRM